VPRFERRFIVHQNQYRRFSAEELNDMHLPFGIALLRARSFPKGAQNAVQATTCASSPPTFAGDEPLGAGDVEGLDG